MKKIILALLFVATAIFPMLSDKTPITIIIRKQPTTPIGGGIGRAPSMTQTVDLMLDDATGELTITAAESLNGVVYVYNIDGEQECYSPVLNTTVTLPQIQDIHIISLQGETWAGEGKVVY